MKHSILTLTITLIIGATMQTDRLQAGPPRYHGEGRSRSFQQGYQFGAAIGNLIRRGIQSNAQPSHSRYGNTRPRNYYHTTQPRYYHPTPTYNSRSPQYSQPSRTTYLPQNRVVRTTIPQQVTVPQNTVPSKKVFRSSVPKNSIPKRPATAVARANLSLADVEFLQLTEEERQQLNEILEEQRDNSINDLGTSLNTYNQEAEQAINQSPLSQQKKNELVGLMAAGDVEGIDRFFQRNPAAQGLQNAVKGVAEMNQNFGSLNGDSLAASAAALERFGKAQQKATNGLLATTNDPATRTRIQNLDVNANQQSQDTAVVNGLLQSLNADPTGGWGNGLPTGNANIVYVPGLPADAWYPIEQGLICGTGGIGKLDIQQRPLANECGFPLSTSTPVGEAVGATRRDAMILISNPAENGGAIHFLLEGKSETLVAGAEREFKASKALSIQFDRGNGTGTEEYSLDPDNAFEFNLANGAWDLNLRQVEIVLDNTANENEFHYVMDSEVVSVPAGKTRRHSATRPIEVRFDRGNGEESRKVLDSGRYQIAVSLESMTWDLHLVDDSADTPARNGSSLSAKRSPSLIAD